MIAHQQPVGGYPLAFLRFAQYAFIRFPIAAFSAALHWCLFCVAFGFGVALSLAFGLGFGRGLALAFCFGFGLALAFCFGLAAALAGGPTMLAARCKVAISLWSWVIRVCLAAMALVISLNSPPSPAAGRVHGFGQSIGRNAIGRHMQSTTGPGPRIGHGRTSCASGRAKRLLVISQRGEHAAALLAERGCNVFLTVDRKLQHQADAVGVRHRRTALRALTDTHESASLHMEVE